MNNSISDVNILLDELYTQCSERVSKAGGVTAHLSDEDEKLFKEIIDRAESSKGVSTVLLTSLVYKHLNPDQDIRYHQEGLPNGYSGRTFDTKYITPFLKKHKFPAMAESGWLTRSLEQKSPYNLKYKGSIRPVELKKAFLIIIHKIQEGHSAIEYLQYIIESLIVQREKSSIRLARPANITIERLVNYLINHFNTDYSSHGAARLPVLAIYAIYQCLIKETKRFQKKRLLQLESHTSADSRSGRIADIDILDDSNRVFEAIEVKHGIPISVGIVKDAYQKFSTTPVKRYYILSTANIVESEKDLIAQEIENIRQLHGCQVIVNGMISSLNYYLRLLNDPYEFIEAYVTLLETDNALKFEHKQKWNEIISGHQ